jgi:hypothetical protein
MPVDQVCDTSSAAPVCTNGDFGVPFKGSLPESECYYFECSK